MYRYNNNIIISHHKIMHTYFYIQTSSYQTTPHDSTHQSMKPRPYGWSHSDQSTMSVYRGGGGVTPQSAFSDQHNTAMIKSVYVQNIGWAMQVKINT